MQIEIYTIIEKIHMLSSIELLYFICGVIIILKHFNECFIFQIPEEYIANKKNRKCRNLNEMVNYE